MTADLTPEPKCALCGEPMPEGEEMFMYHGYSGPCPKPPKPTNRTVAEARAELQRRFDHGAWGGKMPTQGLDFDIDRLVSAVLAEARPQWRKQVAEGMRQYAEQMSDQRFQKGFLHAADFVERGGEK